MIISRNKKFVFFHLYKVAGTSIRNSLSKYHDFEYRCEGHDTPNDLISKYGKEFYNSLFKFSFVRNPWDWQVSLYSFMLNERQHFQHNLIKNMTFDEYIEWRVNEDFKTQYSFLSENNDHNSPITLDYIGKLENIEHDFNEITQKIGIDANLAHLNKSPHKNYKEYYTKNHGIL